MDETAELLDKSTNVSPTPSVSSSDANTTLPRKSGRRWMWLGLICLVTLGAGYWPARYAYVSWLESSCRTALQAKDWPKLETQATRWAYWQPGRTAPWAYAAQAAHELERDDRAVDYLDRVPDRDPKSAQALLERSHLLFGALNRPLEGAAACERALRINPTLVEAHRRLIFFYAYTLQRRKMIDQIGQAIEWDCDLPETYIYLVGQEWLSFSNGYSENTKWMQSAREEELFLVARAIYRVSSLALDDDPEKESTAGVEEGGIPYHLQVLTQYLERFPKNVELLAYFLHKAAKEGDVERVAELLAKVPPEAAADPRFWRYQGWLHEARDELSAAERAYRKALELNPYDYLARHQLAGVLRLQGKMGEVEPLERIHQEGRVLRREVLSLPNVSQAPRSLLYRLASHISNCGQTEIAEKMGRRLQTLDRMGRG